MEQLEIRYNDKVVTMKTNHTFVRNYWREFCDLVKAAFAVIFAFCAASLLILISVGIPVAILYAVCHFVAKYW